MVVIIKQNSFRQNSYKKLLITFRKKDAKKVKKKVEWNTNNREKIIIKNCWKKGIPNRWCNPGKKRKTYQLWTPSDRCQPGPGGRGGEGQPRLTCSFLLNAALERKPARLFFLGGGWGGGTSPLGGRGGLTPPAMVVLLSTDWNHNKEWNKSSVVKI